LHTLKLLSADLPAAGGGRASSEVAESLRSSVEDLQVYMNDILGFARCEHVAQGMSAAPVDLQAVFQDLNVQFEDLAHSLSVDLRFRTTTLELLTDRLMLTRILENLISNAVKFSRPGGKVLVAARSLGGRVRLEVWDQGTGIPLSAQEAVFQPFYQLPYYSRRVDGAGLGLAIVERLSRALGYSIDVRSVEGRGTLMRVLAPSN
ncbi:MAG TPA: ATP-binding protein, partial [Ramlibacter sp.]|nr:ATP-binding protein [Ramlibacter sp.]